MNTLQILNNLLNNIKIGKKYTIIPYTKKIYLICIILKKYSIFKSIYKVNEWLFVYFMYSILKKNIIIKTFNLKNKQNFYTFKQLKKLNVKYKYGIIFTSKGICSLNTAIKFNQGGSLFCLIQLIN